ncbi:DNA-3-methyladenine glycosylase [Rhodohalobacter sp. SW132]|uniref:DNA-3-methyladenine glycosylase n=1 Tax=Rhodohalobacter sp. SW132 TaxID=2293433 RepID=UPI000E247FA9|nr:DNA-3-methyladenine glycosylase [Rhodohalobacter sp. SW132]REL38423.1 DNA-3-methyladenine glycosylase [Rhodohalobacter sp. SW132]
MINKEALPGHDFYARPDVVQVSKDLLGCTLHTFFDGEHTSGIIVETEAYCGRNDKACHANNGTRTDRTEVMYGPPGHCYVYLCYGIHHLFNVVTNREGLADAVLVRALQPLNGVEIMKKRRGMEKIKHLTDGPGKLSQALAIHTNMTGSALSEPLLWIEQRRQEISDEHIEASKRIGVDYAGEDALRKWRFTVDSGLFR